jgi:hypothetical protein
MRKSIYILAVAIIVAVLMSGCVIKDPAKEIVTKAKSVIPQPTVAPASGVQEESALLVDSMLDITGELSDAGYSQATQSSEYAIRLKIQNTAQDPVTFDKIIVKFDDRFEGKTIIINIFPMTLAHGQIKEQDVATNGLSAMQETAEWSTGKKIVKMHVSLKNGNTPVSGDYMAPLPAALDGQNNQLTFAKQ